MAVADELDDVMAEHKKRKRTELEANETREASEAGARDQAAQAMRAIAEPAFVDSAAK